MYKIYTLFATRVSFLSSLRIKDIPRPKYKKSIHILAILF